MKCSRCSKRISLWNRDIFTGLCVDCTRSDAIQSEREFAARLAEERKPLRPFEEQDQQRLQEERTRRESQGRPEPSQEPVHGIILIVVSIVTGLVSVFLLREKDSAPVGQIGLGITGMIYLAGVIRWAVSGSQSIQLDRIQKRINRVIELLEKKQ